mmetsp:Transcript_32506/g.67091  ORF Transcript_32506/g.67091 Transcript_32506/m.67091 type:complete len:217 (-) Transcript_32506:194-844(-)
MSRSPVLQKCLETRIRPSMRCPGRLLIRPKAMLGLRTKSRCKPGAKRASTDRSHRQCAECHVDPLPLTTATKLRSRNFWSGGSSSAEHELRADCPDCPADCEPGWGPRSSRPRGDRAASGNSSGTTGSRPREALEAPSEAPPASSAASTTTSPSPWMLAMLPALFAALLAVLPAALLVVVSGASSSTFRSNHTTSSSESVVSSQASASMSEASTFK